MELLLKQPQIKE